MKCLKRFLAPGYYRVLSRVLNMGDSPAPRPGSGARHYLRRGRPELAVISLFLSSTFRDFHSERDLLTGPIRAALDERVAQLGCRVEMIDLRWGVASENERNDDARQNQVLDVCLNEIERARPLFVGLLGERFGWTPPEARMARVAAEAGLDGNYAGWSVTALEFEFGVLARGDVESVFFDRQLDGSLPETYRDADPAPVQWIRKRVQADPSAAVHSYRADFDGSRVHNLSEFELLATAVLGDLVERRARALTSTEVDPISVAIELFAEERLAAFVGREPELGAVYSAAGAGRSVCLVGDSGTGKSSIWCTAMAAARASGHRVVAVPVGVAPDLLSSTQVVGRIAAEFGLQAPPLAGDELREWFRSALAGLGPITIGVDSLDSFALESVADAVGVVASLPVNVMVIATTTEAAHAEALSRIGFDVVTVSPFEPVDVLRVIESVTARYRRNLPAAAVAQLAARSRSPLWLTLAVGELNALNEEDFATVDPAVDPIFALAQLVTDTVSILPPDIAGLVGRVAERAEQRFGTGVIKHFCGLLTVSRSGLTPYDLAVLTGLDDLTVAAIRRAFDGVITIGGAGGRLRFRHAAAKRALWSRYVPNRKLEFDRRLARYLASIPDGDVESRDDSLWHAMFSQAKPSAAAILGSQRLFDPAALRAIAVFATAVVELDTQAIRLAFTDLDDKGLRFLTSALDNSSSYHRVRLPLEAQAKVTAVATECAQQLASSRPIEDQSWDTLAISISLCSKAARNIGELDRAYQLAGEALSFGKAHHAATGAEAAAQHVMMFYEDLAELAALHGDEPQALEHMENALVLARYNAAGGDPDSFALLAGRLSNAEILARRAGRPEEGEKFRREAESVQSLTGKTIDSKGDPLHSLESDGGKDLTGESLDPRSPVLSAARDRMAHNPSSLDALAGLRVNLVLAAAGALQFEEFALARSLALEAVQIARTIAAQEPSNSEYQNDLAVSINQLAIAAIMTDDLELADRSYTESLQIDRRQVATRPSDIRAARHLGVSLQGAGRIAQELQRYDDAKALFEERVQILTKLEDHIEGHPVLMLEVATAHYDVADLAAEQEDLRDQVYWSYRSALLYYRLALLAGCDRDNYEGFTEVITHAQEWAEDKEDFDFGLEVSRIGAEVGDRILDPDDDPSLYILLVGHIDNAGRMEGMLGDPEAAATSFLGAAQALARVPKWADDYRDARSIVISHLRGTAKLLLRPPGGKLIAPTAHRQLAMQCNTVARLLKYTPLGVAGYLGRE